MPNPLAVAGNPSVNRAIQAPVRLVACGFFTVAVGRSPEARTDIHGIGKRAKNRS